MQQGQFGGAKVVKDVLLKNSAKEKLINGINTLADAVSSTLGAGGRTVLIEDDFGNSHITKDGVTVAESIILQDPVENIGASLVKQAAQQTASKAGDGTTTSTVLAQAIINNFTDANSKHSFRDLRKGVEKLQDLVLSDLDDLSIDVTEDKLKEVAIISSNNEEELGTLIAEAFIIAGEDGIVNMENSNTADTYIETVEGTRIDSTTVHRVFFTNQETERAELNKPLIFLTKSEIPNIRKIESILEYAIKSGRPIVIVGPTGSQVTSAIAMNHAKGNMKALIVGAPSFGHKQDDILEDLALLTGATVYDESLGDSLDSITTEMLGEALKIVSGKDGTIFFFDEMTAAVQERIDNLKEELKESPELERHLKSRLSILQGGISQIFVGAETDTELKEKKDRVDDAINAVQAARKEGILPGGGSALHWLGKTLEIEGNEGEKEGAEILRQSLFSPFDTILENAGLDPLDYVIDKWGHGVDAIDGKVKDMFGAGIIDPTTVTKESLKNAVSVAMTILSTDAVISNVRMS